MLCQLLLHSTMNKPYVPSFGLPSPLGHYSALSRVLCATQYVHINFIHGPFYTWSILYMISIVYKCQSQSPKSSHPISSPLVSIPNIFS